MGAFDFHAFDRAGTARRGVIEASSADRARRLLRERDMLPVAVAAADVGPSAPGRVGAKALATLTRQLATLVGSGVRVEDALRLVAAQSSRPVAAVLLGVRGAVLDGRALATALAGYKRAFPDFYRASIAAAEQSGTLPEVFAHLADFVDARQRAAARLCLALLYPALLAAVSLAMISALLVYVVPDIVRVFVSRGADLPFLTRALIASSNGVQHYGGPVAAAAIAAGVMTRRWLARPANRLAFDQIIATTRPFAGFSRQLNAARFTASLATLVRSSVPLLDAIVTAAAVTPNSYVRVRAAGVAARIREGTSLSAAMAEAGVFPPMLVAIVASGENSGRLGPVLARAATDLERDLETMTATLTGLIEPGVLLAMGAIVLLMVLSILLPIINLNDLAGM